MHFIELPKFTLTAEQVETPLEAWCYFLRFGETLDSTALPSSLDLPPFHRALGILDMMTKSDEERERYEDRLKALRDQAAFRKESLEEGRKQGKLMERIRFCQLLLKQAQTPEEELETLSLEDLARLADELQRQVLPPGS
jgi:predicted transposase/invertase (TIGR01784 family)